MGTENITGSSKTETIIGKDLGVITTPGGRINLGLNCDGKLLISPCGDFDPEMEER